MKLGLPVLHWLLLLRPVAGTAGASAFACRLPEKLGPGIAIAYPVQDERPEDRYTPPQFPTYVKARIRRNFLLMIMLSTTSAVRTQHAPFPQTQIGP